MSTEPHKKQSLGNPYRKGGDVNEKGNVNTHKNVQLAQQYITTQDLIIVPSDNPCLTAHPQLCNLVNCLHGPSCVGQGDRFVPWHPHVCPL